MIKEDNINLGILRKCIFNKEKGTVFKYILQVVTAFVFVMLFIKYGFSISYIKYSILVSFLILISIIDYRTQYIYSSVIYLAIAVSVVFIFLQNDFVYDYITAGILGFIMAALIVILSRGGMGWGDADIFLLAGLNLGLYFFIKVFIATFLLSGLVCAYNCLRGRKRCIALTPFITIGVLIILFSSQ